MRLASIIVLGSFLSHGPAIADDSAVPAWPQFRGKGGLGVAESGRYPTEFGPDKNVVWKTAIPRGVSSPCIWGERIFLTSYTADSKTLETLCLDRKTGEILWRRPAAAKEIERVHEISSPANATPATDGERVYVYFASAGLLCYDFEGNDVWQVPLALKASRFGSGTSPIVVGDVVVLNHDEPGLGFLSGASLLAVDRLTGKPAWKTARAGGMVLYSSPSLCTGEGFEQVLLAASQRLSAYNLADGKEAWWIEGLPPQVVGTPIVVGDRAFFSATGMFGEAEGFVGLPRFDEFLKQHDADADGLVDLAEIPETQLLIDRRASGGAGDSPVSQFARMLDPDNNREITKEEWDNFQARSQAFLAADPGLYAVRLGGEGNVTETHMLWKATKGVAEVPSLLAYQDRLYLVRNGGLVHCRNLEDGRELYTGRLDAVGGYFASPVAGDSKVYLASDRGMVTVIAAGDELEVLSQNDLGEPIMATPALVDGTLYVRTEGWIYAFGEG